MSTSFRLFRIVTSILVTQLFILGAGSADAACTCDQVRKGTCVPPGSGTGHPMCTPPPTFGPPTISVDTPRGSYQQTCRNVRFNGDVLAADCKTFNGAWTPAMLLGAQTPPCLADIENCNGRLFCNRGSMPPPGSYKESCRCTHVSATTLTADCRRSNGTWSGESGISTQLPNFASCRNGIDNIDGALRCH